MKISSLFPMLLALAATGIPAAHAQDAPRLAKIIELSQDDTGLSRQFFGRVAARETVDLAFQVGGQIVDFPVGEGQELASGDLIARLDQEPFELALDRARSQQAQANRNLQRLEQLQGSAVSQVSVDDARTEAELAAISVRDAERALEETTLMAPFDALTASTSTSNFTTIAAGAPVVRLHDMSEIRIEINVPEILVQMAGKTQDFELWAEFPTDDQRYPLEIREFSAETSVTGQTYRVTLGLEPPEDRVILPGSSASVTVSLPGHENYITIPSSAIVTANDGTPQAMLFEPVGATEGTVRLVGIQIEGGEDGTVSVISGLEPGQEIVASGAAILDDGETVRRFTAFGE
ncbi:efflux RND transporter periplasmic adaptor subunit [Salipiger sp. PrR003]|uniref:efflux RND transporter periplasmic adaptor subunit n=1 Tax=Salipiger sp. PrR003 TaxID=2706776 RepID=UPI0013DA270E|nr:efflux RND transporter periplasmic adaptor subunit [Salipiger sp. PrR003]NDV52730.1 efflux RND transporter periplasmic adaptor subunit [Salipiger sp. PrR003]